jgi:hypothetical protein
MSSKDTGLISKYIVDRWDGKPVGWCFVLEGKDPLAWPALLTYADMAEGAGYLELAKDLRAKVAELGIGPGPMERTWEDRPAKEKAP